jgi:RsiW-degrading membrane proteinase PrsW (M82 family)
MARGFLLAAGLHGLYDFIVLQQSLNALPIAALLIVGGWIWRLRLMRRLQESALRGGGNPSRGCTD